MPDDDCELLIVVGFAAVCSSTVWVVALAT